MTDPAQGVVRTMGVKQQPNALDVCVMEWQGGKSDVLFGGTMRGAARTTAVVHIAESYGVRRALVETVPDAKLAVDLIREQPAVFASQDGRDQTAASLAEIAYRRMTLSQVDVTPGSEDRTTTLAVVPAHLDGALMNDVRDTHEAVVVRHFVPPGQKPPTHIVVPLGDEQPGFERPDGSRLIEHLVPMDKVTPLTVAVEGDAAPVGFAPGTLPLTSWSVVLGFYAGQTLVWEVTDSSRGLLELGTVAGELAQRAAAWVQENAVNIEAQYPDVNAGPLPDPEPPPY